MGCLGFSFGHEVSSWVTPIDRLETELGRPWSFCSDNPKMTGLGILGVQVSKVVVNLADSLQVWTNDRYRASVHRVVPMTKKARYSIPYFYNPPLDATIQPIPGIGDSAPHYRPFTWKEFIQARIDDNFADLDAEDTQASHFRIV